MTARSSQSVIFTALMAAFTWAFAIGTPSAQAKREQGPPRTIDGQPDIQGVWGGAENGQWTYYYEPRPHLDIQGWPKPRPGAKIQSNSGEIPAPAVKMRTHALYDPPDGILPYQPWALERRNSVLRGHTYPELWQMDTQTPGWPSGVPRENSYSSVDGSYGGPIHILQPPGYVVFMYETHHEFRAVPLDARPQPGKDIKMWEGSSRGRCEGTTLAIDVSDNNDSVRVSVIGDFHSDETHATERWTFVDKDRLEYRCTVTDLKVFTMPWTMGLPFVRTPRGT